MNGVNEIRKTFLKWFGDRDHEIVQSAPLVPINDPSLMFTAAGMVPFKNLFTGIETRDYVRAVSSQKCVRAGGKHNDLDNVGYTARHHTFFEMLGNFSFGDYSKDVAIEHAWKLITEEFGLDKKRLWATVYHTDEEAFELWRKIAGLGEDRILKINSKDNFWEMGEVGPCGPCSEIFFDHGEKIEGGPPGSENEDGDRFVEIWNLVFMQFEKTAEGEQIDLPKASIDTGMGLERIAAVLCGSHDNYDIDLFRNLIGASENILGVESDANTGASHRVIADHIRASGFLIADGVLPANEGRGYVLRRIMRRAMRHANMLGATEPLLWKLTASLIKEMGEAYAELGRHQSLIEETLKLEETRFQKTLSRGLELLETASEGLKKGDELQGEVAFKLYDTYGFPLDLTQDALRRRHIKVNVEGFDKAMEKQKADARASWKGAEGQGMQSDELQGVWFSLSEEVGSTEFLGYTRDEAQGMIVAIVDEKGKRIENVKASEKPLFFIMNQTPFYAESGGQKGDSGIATTTKIEIEIVDTQKQGNGIFVHEGIVKEGEVAVGDGLTLRINAKRRAGLRAHHSATHLLHEALRETLGEHVSQKGSMVTHERLRFDYSHNHGLSGEEKEKIFETINEYVRQNTAVTTTLMAVDDAIALGAQAQFGEKYGEEVRVVAMGHKDKEQNPWSLELCGGTHVERTGDIGLVTFLAESAVGSGIRRIEALTGEAAQRHLLSQEKQLRQAADMLRVAPSDLNKRIETLVEERKTMQKELKNAQKKMVVGSQGDENEKVEKINGVSFKAQIVENVAAKELKGICDQYMKSVGGTSGDCIVVVASQSQDGKAAIVVGVGQKLTDKYNAVDMVKIAAESLGGKGGGGRPDMAQAGGPNAGDNGENIKKAIEKIKEKIAK